MYLCSNMRANARRNAASAAAEAWRELYGGVAATQQAFAHVACHRRRG